MLKFGNKEFRNIQEQVQENMDKIKYLLTEGQILSNFGIKVVDEVDEVSDVPTIVNYKAANPE